MEKNGTATSHATLFVAIVEFPQEESTKPRSATTTHELIDEDANHTRNRQRLPSLLMIPANNSLFPALYLYPLNDTWHPKHIFLTNQHTKIGRQTSSKTAPGERNGFFDSKVLSRQHAEVWEEGGKVSNHRFSSTVSLPTFSIDLH